MCRIIEGHIAEVANHLNELLKRQEENLSETGDERIQSQVTRLQEAIRIISSGREEDIVSYAERLNNEINNTSIEERTQRDINFDNWIILVEISNLFTNTFTNWANVETSLNNRQRIMNIIRGNNDQAN